MKVLFASSEIVPLAKTGGLADVCGSLPVELAKLGHELFLFMPAYRGIADNAPGVRPTDIDLQISIGNKIVSGSLLESKLPGTDISLYLVRQDEYYDRKGIYGDADGDYPDNCERFVFFCRATLEAIRQLDLKIDLAHVHDWPTSLIPAYLKLTYAGVPGYEQIASVLTIHNLAYQGRFWHWDMLLTGLDWKYFNWKQMEFHGDLCLLKTGLVFADALTAVSPRYAQEIQSFPLGCGLEGVLSHRGEDLHGIINGVDYTQWNPASDPHLVASYDAESFETGKPLCKAAVQATFNLPAKPETPLIGFIGRLAGQKGVDLITSVMQQWSQQQTEVQWVILGSGDSQYEQQLRALADRYPDRVGVRLEFSEPLAHQIEAGADIFLMPSRYEPCGLNQLYSLRYGTVPVVRETGGLADTVTDTDSANLAAGTATGFRFVPYTAEALAEALRRACDCYHEKQTWRQIVATGMRKIGRGDVVPSGMNRCTSAR